MEKFLETVMYRSRWILAPIYLGLSLALFALGIKFFQEVWHLLAHIVQMKETDMVLVVLSLVDIAMVGGLLVMVMMSGYENFVSPIDFDQQEEQKLSWLGTLDASSLKAKIAASIIAISSIHLLKAFMSAPETSNETLFWYVVIHMTFVVSAYVMGMLEYKTKKTKL